MSVSSVDKNSSIENIIPSEKPKNLPDPSTIRIFRGLTDLDEFCNDIELKHERPNRSGADYYDDLYDRFMLKYEELFTDSATKSDKDFYLGEEPRPKSLEDAMNRASYNRMEDFNDIYRRIIEPESANLLKKSVGELDVPSFTYNDREIGFFDYSRASIALFSQYEYYSIIHKKIVEGNDVETYKDGTSYKYKLRSDGTPCVVVPKLKEGYSEEVLHEAFMKIYNGEDPIKVLKDFDFKLGSVSSMIRKSYVHKEPKPKLKNAVRLFIVIGGDSSKTADQLKWSGYLGIGIANILESMGYSITIHVVFGNFLYLGMKKPNGSYEEGHRVVCVPVKKFNETVDAMSLLYAASDNTFFRMKFFKYIIKLSQYYGDALDWGLGRPSDSQFLEKAVISKFTSIDPIFNKNGKLDPTCPFLYYLISACHSENDFRKMLRDLILDVVNKNKEARELSGYVETI